MLRSLRIPRPPHSFERRITIERVAGLSKKQFVVNVNLSVMGAPKLTDFDSFLAYSRNPRRPNGKIGIMPPVPETKLSNRQMQQLYEFITKVLERPRRTMDEPQ